MHTVSMVAALGLETRAIGRNGKDLWEIPDDRKRFRQLTTGHPVIMGRKTWEAIPEKFRPLPNRSNIVVTRNSGYQAQGAIVTMSLVGAIEVAKGLPGFDELFIIGGGEMYAQGLLLAQKLCLTVVDDGAEGDAHFPMYQDAFTKCTFEESHEHNGMKYTFLNLERE